MPALALAVLALVLSASGYAVASYPGISTTVQPPTGQAFAHVTAYGTLVNPSFEASGIQEGDVLRASPGHYCISGLDFTPRGATATPAVFMSRMISVALGKGACPTGTQVEVIATWDGQGMSDVPFFIRIY
jgi:hypothetical protein